MRCTFLWRTQSVLRGVRAATEVKSVLRSLPYERRLGFLRALHSDVLNHEEQIMAANRLDCSAFAQQQHNVVSPRPSFGKSSSSFSVDESIKNKWCEPSYNSTHSEDRTELSPLRIKKLLAGIEGLMRFPDPISTSSTDVKITQETCSSCQLAVQDVPVPLGVVGVLSRYRPRMTLDAVAMCIQSGNAVIIDGGASVMNTNGAIMASVRRALIAADIPVAAVVFVEANETENDVTAEWLQASDSVDLGIVCGNSKLYHYACQRAAIPLIRASGRACSLYVDKSADYETALRVVLNAKFQRPNATNAVNTLILHESYPRIQELLHTLNSQGVLLLGDTAAKKLASSCIDILASEEVYNGLTEGLADFHRVLCVKVVRDLRSAIYFLDLFGSGQSDGIIATDESAIREYCDLVDTAVVLVNASTRLSSGTALGRGADLAIATSKVHARGPLTLAVLTTKKIVVRSMNPEGALRQ
ncbi:gamma-glutamyl phosphate reductase-like protein [Trypanosoma theileri]|uniref:Gamma-glutamyl phosphate reductase-like protein n=1 Tax=Trypanosoma theileri TaxID=67003 RepID=A0A1X0NJJ4_9TRYP|nr:gamma-glutamyl phosphate reductase-like protein [Trypanosoma theileri]ORC84944.1 gamma-glutamyl phosphate reductase-like protein [Trypanosoma theileri]